MVWDDFVHYVVRCGHDFDERVLMQVYSLLTYQHEMHSVNIDDDLDQFVVAAAVVVVAKIKIIHQMKFTSKKNSFTSADGVVLGLTALVCCGVGVADDVVVVVVVVLAEGETVGSVGGETTNGICRTG